MSQKQITSATFAKKLMTLLSGSRLGEVMWARCSTSSVPNGQILAYKPVYDLIRHVKRAFHLKERTFPQFEKKCCIFCDSDTSHGADARYLSLTTKTKDNSGTSEDINNEDEKVKTHRHFTKRLSQLFTEDSFSKMILKSEMRSGTSADATCSALMNVTNSKISKEANSYFSCCISKKTDKVILKLNDYSNVYADTVYKRLLSSTVSAESTAVPNGGDEKPSREQQLRVYNILRDTLPKLFIQPMDYTIYHQNIICENSIRGTRTQGLLLYVCQIAALRVIGHIKFAYVKFDVLKITLDTKENMVKVRWRIRGISGLKVFIYFWKYKIWNMREAMEELQESWSDGLSTYCIGTDGKVFRHIIDKVTPEEETSPADLQNPLSCSTV